jgi:group I intron endonuclease
MVTTNKNFSCIYIIISPSNKIYIGRTICFRKRENSYKRMDCKEQIRLFRSFQKYGVNSHQINVLLKCDIEELNFWEHFYIKLFNTFNSEYGLNLTSGGDANEHNEETKLKIGKSNKGKIISKETREKQSIIQKEKYRNLTQEEKISRGKKIGSKLKGLKKTEEWKLKMSVVKSGVKRGSLSEEWKRNLSKSTKGIKVSKERLENIKIAANKRKERNGYLMSEEQKGKMINSLKEFYKTDIGKEKALKSSIIQMNNSKSVKVNQYTMEGVFIKDWASMGEIKRELGIHTSHISNCINNKRKFSHGFIWKKAI